VLRNAEIRELVRVGYRVSVVREHVRRGATLKVVEQVIDDIVKGENDRARRLRSTGGIR